MNDLFQVNTHQSYFDQFWNAGMRRLNKKAARKSFDRIIKSQPDKQAFVDMLVEDIQARFRLQQFGFDKMHPTTYLNGERWEDDRVIEESNKPKSFLELMQGDELDMNQNPKRLNW